MKALLAQGFDAVLRRLRRAARPRPADCPAAQEAARQHPHRHRLAGLGVVRPCHAHRQARSSCSAAATPRWTAAARRGASAPSDVKVIVRSRLRRDEGLAVGEGRRDARRHPDHQLPCARRPSCTTDGRLVGMRFEIVEAGVRREGPAQPGADRRSPRSMFDCDDVLIAVGQENAFPWIERDCGIAFDERGLPVLDQTTFQSSAAAASSSAATRPSARRTSSPRWPTATRRRCRSTASCTARTCAQRPPPHVNLMSQKMGIHEWSYDNAVEQRPALQGALGDGREGAGSIKVEVELGFDARHRVQGSRSAA